MSQFLTTIRIPDRGIPTKARPIRTRPRGTGWSPAGTSTKADNLAVLHAQRHNELARGLSIIHTRDITS